MRPRRSIVVAGHGMAGARFVQDLRALDPERRFRVTILSAEREVAYNRVLLSSVLAGSLTPAQVEMVPSAWYAAEDVDLRTGLEVERIDRERRLVHTSGGDSIEYDELVLATGSTAWIPPIAGLTRADGGPAEDVVVFRTLDDCRDIAERAGAARQVAVLGGGLLGLEAARGLAGRGLDVTVVHAVDRLMERQLDSSAGRTLARTMRSLGVRVRLNAGAQEFRRDEAGAALVLDDGSRVPADFVVVACGVRPNVDLARDAGLVVDRAIVVDDHMTTVSDPHVHAIGECAQHAGQVYGLVAPVWEQAGVLADVLTGGSATYRGSLVVTRLKAAGVDLAAMGEVIVDGHSDDDATDNCEVVSFADPARGTYQKVVIRDDRITGAIMLGDCSDTVGLVTQLFDRGAPVPHDRRALIFPGVQDASAATDPAGLPDETTVCRCNGVSCGQIREACKAGAEDVEDVAAATRATTGCGTCRRDVAAIIGSVEVREPVEVSA